MVARLILSAALVMLTGAAPVALSAPFVTVVRAGPGTVVETVALTGTLVARDEVLVSSQIDGLAIVTLRAEEGDRVAASQVLATLAADALTAQLAQNTAQAARADAAIAQAVSSAEEAEANRTQAEQALARTRDLLGSGNASRELMEQRQAAFLAATARLALAQNTRRAAEADRALADAQRRELEVRLGYTAITAPVAGIVSRRSARLGAVVSQTGEPLFRLIEDGVIELEADVPEVALSRLTPGQTAAIVTPAGPRSGTVRLVAPEINRATRLGRVRVAITDGTHLALGGFARARVEVARQDGIVLPLAAIQIGEDSARVQVVNDGVVETRSVRVLLRDGARAAIAGVRPGEAVIAIAGTFVRDGDRVVAVE